ncbi:MAG: Cof-type HAD-IIB family hydrolase [Sphaerochaetaceae bacterium]|nr:Cof-type HAD-IIB family hydrolase [Sphaerochaetaceae bacterium]
MIKLAAFDLDDTLAKIGKGISHADLSILGEIEKEGVQVAVVSGKPAFYLCGFMRQVEIENPILIGENGGVIEFGVDVPPARFYTLDYSEEARLAIEKFKREFSKAIPSLWYQPNHIGLTPFPAKPEEFDIIQSIVDRNSQLLEYVDVYRHVDSFDITPKGINKYKGLEKLTEILGITREETVAVGNGVNDYPMFDFAGLSIGINIPDKTRAKHNVASSYGALSYLINLIRAERLN